MTVVGEQSFSLEECYAITYLTVEQAQEALHPRAQYPRSDWKKLQIKLSEQQQDLIEEKSGVSVLSDELNVWQTADGDFFIVDNVLGKHEYITYAVVIDSAGSINGIEILEYKEAYGDEIRRKEWRTQFVGKTFNDKIELEEDIINISGATISCANVTKGTKRLIATYEVVLKYLTRQ
jgi:Na+-translocating ferredoxin:NAD+ oxidoreductase RnfG subunit